VLVEHNFEAACFYCGSSFEIIPPIDPRYCIPREQPRTEDYLSCAYKCNGSHHHKNAVYWERDDIVSDTGHFSRHFEKLEERRQRENSDVTRFTILPRFSDTKEKPFI
jgi:hypothetical protein